MNEEPSSTVQKQQTGPVIGIDEPWRRRVNEEGIFIIYLHPPTSLLGAGN